jgi:hypothetical protein
MPSPIVQAENTFHPLLLTSVHLFTSLARFGPNQALLDKPWGGGKVRLLCRSIAKEEASGI